MKLVNRDGGFSSSWWQLLSPLRKEEFEQKIIRVRKVSIQSGPAWELLGLTLPLLGNWLSSPLLGTGKRPFQAELSFSSWVPPPPLPSTFHSHLKRCQVPSGEQGKARKPSELLFIPLTCLYCFPFIISTI